MARRRKAIEEEPEQLASTRRTLSIRLDDEGKIDLASMRSQTVESLKEAIEGSSLFDSGSEDQAVNEFETKKAVYSQVVPALLGVIGAAESIVVAQNMKLPYDEVRGIMGYSEEEVALLTEPASIVLSKRMPEGFGWTEEVTLALLLLQIHQVKMVMLSELKARSERKIVDIRKEPETSASVQ
jgi:hypothetical protein